MFAGVNWRSLLLVLFAIAVLLTGVAVIALELPVSSVPLMTVICFALVFGSLAALFVGSVFFSKSLWSALLNGLINRIWRVRSTPYPEFIGRNAMVVSQFVFDGESTSTGTVRIDGQIWGAKVGLDASLKPGDNVIVTGRDGLTLFVKPEAIEHDKNESDNI